MSIYERNRISFHYGLPQKRHPGLASSHFYSWFSNKKIWVVITMHHAESELPCTPIRHLVFNMCLGTVVQLLKHCFKKHYRHNEYMASKLCVKSSRKARSIRAVNYTERLNMAFFFAIDKQKQLFSTCFIVYKELWEIFFWHLII